MNNTILSMDEGLKIEPRKMYEGIRYNLLEEKCNKEKDGCGCCSLGCLTMASLIGLVLYGVYEFLF